LRSTKYFEASCEVASTLEAIQEEPSSLEKTHTQDIGEATHSMVRESRRIKWVTPDIRKLNERKNEVGVKHLKAEKR
jgi:hypothetical protein